MNRTCSFDQERTPMAPTNQHGTARSRMVRALAAIACACALTFVAAVPANAVSMKFVTGNIKCFAYPNVAVGTSAVARGEVHFQLNALNNAGSLHYVKLGYSATYANWSWKFWTAQAGDFIALAYGSSANVTAASRWCHNING
jgi:hypothetical protein